MQTTTPLRLLIIILLSILAAFFLRDHIAERIYVPTPSMKPAMPAGTHWWQEKLTLLLREPRRGDVIVFESPLGDSKELIKRVIAVAGETVVIENKEVSINGSVLSEPYKHHDTDMIFAGDNLGPLTVPAHHVFVLGDNRDHSGDSRDWHDVKTGEPVYFIAASKIRGKVFGVR
ncbi:MAG: signal peptidase I [Elusimicrobiota bacterium]